MTQGKHTKGPWVTEVDLPYAVQPRIHAGAGHDEKLIACFGNVEPNAQDEWEANATRACAAVNACEGIPTEALEAGVVKDMLGALRNLCTAYASCNGEDHPAYIAARAAIARTTGEKP